MHPDSLHDLLARYAATRSEPVFGEFVNRAGPLVWRVAMRRLEDAQLAEEVSQNVLIRVARKADTLAGRAGLTAWLHRAAVLEAANFSRSRRRKAADRERALLAAPPTGVPSGAETPGGPWLDEALNSLTEEDRAVLLGRYYEERGFREIASSLGKTEEAAKKQSQRALAKLRALLERRGVTLTLPMLIGAAGAEYSSAAPLPAGALTKLAGLLSGPALPPAPLSAFARFTLLMSTPKAVSGAAVLFLLLLGAAAWLDLGNAERRMELADLLRKSRPMTGELSAVGGQLTSLKALRNRATTRGKPEDVPPDPLTGEALVRARSRELRQILQHDSGSGFPALYDSGFSFRAAGDAWKNLPEEEWTRVLGEVDASHASAGLRAATISGLLSLAAEKNPGWAAEEMLRRRDTALRTAIQKWTETDPLTAWRWIRGGVESGRLARFGAGFAADPEEMASQAFASTLTSHDSFKDGAILTDLLRHAANPEERTALLADCAAAMAGGEAGRVASFLTAHADPATVRSVLVETLPSFVRHYPSPSEAAAPLLELVGNAAFPAESRQEVLREGLSRVPAGRLWNATYAMAAAGDPATREEDLVWLAEKFAAARTSGEPLHTADPLAVTVAEGTARALERKGNLTLADWYRASVSSSSAEVTPSGK